jgi:hypothetical protein
VRDGEISGVNKVEHDSSWVDVVSLSILDLHTVKFFSCFLFFSFLFFFFFFFGDKGYVDIGTIDIDDERLSIGASHKVKNVGVAEQGSIHLENLHLRSAVTSESPGAECVCGGCVGGEACPVAGKRLEVAE